MSEIIHGNGWMMSFSREELNNLVDQIYASYTIEIVEAISSEQALQIRTEIEAIGNCEIRIGYWENEKQPDFCVGIICGSVGFCPGDAVYFKLLTNPVARFAKLGY